MKTIKEVIIVEGKYDKIFLDSIIDATIITTDGFGVYGNGEKLDLLRRFAAERGIIILTDSDAAGFRIRAYIRQCLGNVDVKNAYIPEVSGRERRKQKAGKQGLLGVEGMRPEIVLDALEKAQATPMTAGERVTKADFFADGLSGGADSAARRRQLAKSLGLPQRLSANALLDVINTLYTKEQYKSLSKISCADEILDRL